MLSLPVHSPLHLPGCCMTSFPTAMSNPAKCPSRQEPSPSGAGFPEKRGLLPSAAVKEASVQTQTKDLSRHFSKDDLQRTNMHVKRCGTSLVVSHQQIETTVRCCFTPTGMAGMKKTDNNKVGMWSIWSPHIPLVGR